MSNASSLSSSLLGNLGGVRDHKWPREIFRKSLLEGKMKVAAAAKVKDCGNELDWDAF